MMLTRLDEIIAHCEHLLTDPTTLTDEQNAFTQTILENVHALRDQLTPVITALESHRPGDPFPGDMHDMRTPLVSILGYSDLLSAGVVGTLAPDFQARYAAIHQLGSTIRDEMEHLYTHIKSQMAD